MEDLLRSQIRDSCRLALPEGLKELMLDISREVVRAQPQILYQFIADYLSVLLVTREHLFIASRVCDDVCKNRCCEELEGELRELSLNEEDVEKCLDIIARYFSSGQVKEGNLIQKLIRETDIRQNDLPAIQDAVRRAYLRHQVNNTADIESSSDSELDETALAAKHTLKIYKKAAENPDINYDCVASKIQAAYRAYNVHRGRRGDGHKHSHSKKKEEATEKVRFKVKEQLVADVVHTKRCKCAEKIFFTIIVWQFVSEEGFKVHTSATGASQCSSVSLAGSFLSLPLYKPYSIGQPSDIVEADEVGEKEKERANFDYVTNQVNEEHREPDTKGKKSISFHNLLEVVEPVENYNEVSDEVDVAGYESEEEDEEVINEDIVGEESSTETDVIQEHLTSNLDEIPTLDTTVITGLKEDTESTLTEDYDEVQQNEMERITQKWVEDDAQANKDEDGKESMIMSLADDDEDKQDTNTDAEGHPIVRDDDGADDGRDVLV